MLLLKRSFALQQNELKCTLCLLYRIGGLREPFLLQPWDAPGAYFSDLIPPFRFNSRRIVMNEIPSRFPISRRLSPAAESASASSRRKSRKEPFYQAFIKI